MVKEVYGLVEAIAIEVQLIDSVSKRVCSRDCTEHRGSQPNDSRSSRKIRPATMGQYGEKEGSDSL
jgi:hypothetical protein